MRTPLAILLTAGVTALGLLRTGAAIAQDAPAPPAAPGKPKALPYPEAETVEAALKKAAAYFRSNLSVSGGYAWSWPTDLSESRGENLTSQALIMIQPPGTPSVGRAMLDAYLASGDPLFLQGAREAAHALQWCQFASGGWPADFDFQPKAASRHHYRRDIECGDTEPGKRGSSSSLDDNKTQSALRFLMTLDHALADSEAGPDAPLRSALAFAWDGLLSAQAPNGGWPQRFSGPAAPDLPVIDANFPAEWSRTFPAVDYTVYYTLNDNNLQNLMQLLLEAHQLEGKTDTRYLQAALRLGDFFLRAQLPEPQPAWAQQYDFEMHPAWARKFEPPAVCSVESLGAMKALQQLWLATGEEKYLAPIPAALAWFERSRLEGKDEPTWARFYELQSNAPLYCRAETYEVTNDDSDLPTHYGFQVSGGFGRDLEKIRGLLSESRADQLARIDRATPDSEKGWSERARKSASKARTALAEQKEKGYWMNGDAIDAGEFVKHMTALATYLEASKKGGETFSDYRKKENNKALEEQAAAAGQNDPSNSQPPALELSLSESYSVFTDFNSCSEAFPATSLVEKVCFDNTFSQSSSRLA